MISDDLKRFLRMVNMVSGVVFAVAFGYLTTWMYTFEYIPATRLAGHGVEVRGQVIVERNTCNRCNSRRKPRTPTEVSYQAPGGTWHTTRLTVSATGYVRVLLDPSSPRNCAILEYGEVYSIPPVTVITLVTLAVLTCLSAGWFLYNALALVSQVPASDSASEVAELDPPQA